MAIQRKTILKSCCIKIISCSDRQAIRQSDPDQPVCVDDN